MVAITEYWCITSITAIISLTIMPIMFWVVRVSQTERAVARTLTTWTICPRPPTIPSMIACLCSTHMTGVVSWCLTCLTVSPTAWTLVMSLDRMIFRPVTATAFRQVTLVLHIMELLRLTPLRSIDLSPIHTVTIVFWPLMSRLATSITVWMRAM